jgi:hypothetical protein
MSGIPPSDTGDPSFPEIDKSVPHSARSWN